MQNQLNEFILSINKFWAFATNIHICKNNKIKDIGQAVSQEYSYKDCLTNYFIKRL